MTREIWITTTTPRGLTTQSSSTTTRSPELRLSHARRVYRLALIGPLYALIDYAKLRYQVPRAVHEAVGGDNSKWNTLLGNIGATVTDAKALPPGDHVVVCGLDALRRLELIEHPEKLSCRCGVDATFASAGLRRLRDLTHVLLWV